MVIYLGAYSEIRIGGGKPGYGGGDEAQQTPPPQKLFTPKKLKKLLNYGRDYKQFKFCFPSFSLYPPFFSFCDFNFESLEGPIKIWEAAAPFANPPSENAPVFIYHSPLPLMVY